MIFPLMVRLFWLIWLRRNGLANGRKTLQCIIVPSGEVVYDQGRQAGQKNISGFFDQTIAFGVYRPNVRKKLGKGTSSTVCPIRGRVPYWQECGTHFFLGLIYKWESVVFGNAGEILPGVIRRFTLRSSATIAVDLAWLGRRAALA